MAGRHVSKVPISEVSRTRGVAKTRIVRHMRNGSFEPYSSSSSPSGLRPNVVSDVANELCHRSDLVLTCAGVFLGCIPGLRPDRSGIALSGAALMLAVGTPI
jgi:hypothetical protein